jgi:hypothetical protein
MSDNLKRCARRLLQFAKLGKAEARRALKTAKSNIINALSEIAYNLREGTVNISKRIRNSKIVKTLSQKSVPLKTKYRLLCAAAAPVIVQAIVSSVIAILEALRYG